MYKMARYIGWNTGLAPLLHKLEIEGRRDDTEYAKDNRQALDIILSADKVDFWVDDEGATMVLYKDIDCG